MDDQFLPPTADIRPEVLEGPGPGFGRGAALFVTITALLVGASAYQVASAGPTLMQNRVGLPEGTYWVFVGWVAYTASITLCGAIGVYRALRRGSTAVVGVLLFFLGYSLVFRMGNASFGWPFQLHIGMVAGGLGFGLNLVGVAMAVWWFSTRRRVVAATPQLVASGLLNRGDGLADNMARPEPIGADLLSPPSDAGQHRP